MLQCFVLLVRGGRGEAETNGWAPEVSTLKAYFPPTTWAPSSAPGPRASGGNFSRLDVRQPLMVDEKQFEHMTLEYCSKHLFMPSHALCIKV